ncbi:UNKNOWN [Stylonychia lemnae]|uniref:Uncharacterized protein n=1 Tax=Stylonychia lemnae TaxID=5949 RepID=A0A078A378_STYLE|nr:UNKNOWN [Stylonychia lemnae]|eukprot:CDW75958.1 UNKNOWN [Stylonychia lemnae]
MMGRKFSKRLLVVLRKRIGQVKQIHEISQDQPKLNIENMYLSHYVLGADHALFWYTLTEMQFVLYNYYLPLSEDEGILLSKSDKDCIVQDCKNILGSFIRRKMLQVLFLGRLYNFSGVVIGLIYNCKIFLACLACIPFIILGSIMNAKFHADTSSDADCASKEANLLTSAVLAVHFYVDSVIIQHDQNSMEFDQDRQDEIFIAIFANMK